MLRGLQHATAQGETELDDDARAKRRECDELSLKQQFEQELCEQERSRRQAIDNESNITKCRRSAKKDWLVKFDNQLKTPTGEGLAKFMPMRRRLPWQEGGRLCVSEVCVANGRSEPRCCIEEAPGARCVAAPRQVAEGARQCPELHVAADPSSIGLPAVQFLTYYCGMRLTLSADVPHRVRNDLLGAISMTSLTVLRLEFTRVS